MDQQVNKQQVSNPFADRDVYAPESGSSATVEVVTQRELAEVQAAVMMARRFPRDPIRATDRVLQACTRPTLAQQALYSYSRGGTEITGPSIRLAEAIAQAWGNIQFGIRELDQRSGVSSVEAYAWDLETNVRVPKTFQVPHIRYKQSGSYRLTDPRDIYELIANNGARRMRACILAVIPGDVVEAAQRQCEETLHATLDTSPEALRRMVQAFEEFGVTQPQIEQRCQCRLDAIRPAQVIQLRKIFASLKDGMSDAADWFQPVINKSAEQAKQWQPPEPPQPSRQEPAQPPVQTMEARPPVAVRQAPEPPKTRGWPKGKPRGKRSSGDDDLLGPTTVEQPEPESETAPWSEPEPEKVESSRGHWPLYDETGGEIGHYRTPYLWASALFAVHNQLVRLGRDHATLMENNAHLFAEAEADSAAAEILAKIEEPAPVPADEPADEPPYEPASGSFTIPWPPEAEAAEPEATVAPPLERGRDNWQAYPALITKAVAYVAPDRLRPWLAAQVDTLHRAPLSARLPALKAIQSHSEGLEIDLQADLNALAKAPDPADERIIAAIKAELAGVRHKDEFATVVRIRTAFMKRLAQMDEKKFAEVDGVFSQVGMKVGALKQVTDKDGNEVLVPA